MGWGRKNPMKMLTFRQLTLQCGHHSLTQCHFPTPQFIQNQAPIHRPSHQLDARCHHPRKASILCFRKLKFPRLAFIVCQFERQNNKIRSDRVLSVHRKEARFWFQFGCVLQDNKCTVRGIRASFCRWREHNWGNEGLIPRYGMC